MQHFPLISVLMAHVAHIGRGNPLGWTPMYGGSFAAMAEDWAENFAHLGDGIVINRADGCCLRRLVGTRSRIVSGGGADGGDGVKASTPEAATGSSPALTLGAHGGDGPVETRPEEVRTEVCSADMVSHEEHRKRCYVLRGLVRSTRVVWGTGIPSRAGMDLAIERIRELHVREVIVDVSGQNTGPECVEWMERLEGVCDRVYHEPICHPRQFVEPAHSRRTPTASLPERFMLEGLDTDRFKGSIAVHNTNFPQTDEDAERWAAWGVTPATARQDALRANEVEA